MLTTPSEGVANDRRDNANGDYIFRVGDVISSSEDLAKCTCRCVNPCSCTCFTRSHANRYVVESMFGQGSFGQVMKCYCINNHQTFAVKAIKNLPAYTKQAAIERKVLQWVWLLSYSSRF